MVQTRGNEKTRKRIFDALKPYVIRKEYLDLTARDVCRIANVSTSTFYATFGSLDAFKDEIRNRNADNFRQELDQGTHGDTASEQLRSFASFYARFNEEDGVEFLTKVLKNNINNPTSIVADPLCEKLIEIISMGQDRGEFSSDYSVDQLVDIINVTFHGCLYHWCKANGGYDLETEMQTHISIILHAIRHAF